MGDDQEERNETNVNMGQEASGVANDHDATLEFSEFNYATNSFYTIVSPVFWTMLLAASAVVFISTPEFSQLTEDSLRQTYTVLKSSEDDSVSTKLGFSVVNGLIIVSVICCMTFAIVLLYKFRCMKCLTGYMVVSSTMILGFLASNVVRVAIERYNIQLDFVSYFLLLYNYAIVGVVCIIAPTGIVRTSMNQWYLMFTSIIVAWHFARFDAWTAWVLLVMLALYDLFAVLTPCGPLKALINLMQRDDSPMIPGLLYEASLPGARQNQQATPRNSQARSPRPLQENTPSPEPNIPSNQEEEEEASVESVPLLRTSIEAEAQKASSLPRLNETPEESENQEVTTSQPHAPEYIQGSVPMALAKRFKLRFWTDPQPYWITGEEPTVFTPQQLAGQVEVGFHPNGGRVVPTASLETSSGDFYRRTQQRDRETRYTVIDYQGVHHRVLFVTDDGRLFEDLREKSEEEDRKERTSIKLGLGDFIFYSILVSKAALYSYTTFVVCTLAILSGLGLTMLLLAVYGKALPALPISIFFGVIFFLITRYCIEPYVHFVFTEQCYF